MSSVSGHVFRHEGKRRPVWRAKYRLPDGRQVQKAIGPAWTARGRPPAGYFTKRTAEAWLRGVLAEAADGTLPGMVRTGATVADACAEYLRYVEQDRQRKPSTLRDYQSIFRNYVLPHLGDVALENLTAERVERWAAVEIDPDRRLANRTREKAITVFHGVMERARKLHRLPPTRSPTSRSRAPPCGPRSTSSRLRRSWRWCAPPTPSRTPRSTSPPPSRASASAS
jgi:integrase